MSGVAVVKSTASAGLLARRPLTWFFLIAFGMSWLVWAPVQLAKNRAGLLPYEVSAETSDLVTLAGVLAGPTLAALVMTAVTEGRPGIARLLRRCVAWRFHPGWYALALLGIPALVVLGTAAVSGVWPWEQLLSPSFLLSYPVAFVVMVVLGGPLLEEPGWRGFALPRMQQRFGPLAGSALLGGLWGLWHLPVFLDPTWDTPHDDLGDVALFVASAVAATVIMAWMWNRTGGSLVGVILVHGSINTFTASLTQIYPAEAVTHSLLNVVLGFAAAAIAVIAATRGRLGYPPSR